MASFQAKIGWEMPRKRQNKSFLSVPFLPNAKQKIPKKMKKILKNHYGFISSQNRLEKAAKERK